MTEITTKPFVPLEDNEAWYLSSPEPKNIVWKSRKEIQGEIKRKHPNFYRMMRHVKMAKDTGRKLFDESTLR